MRTIPSPEFSADRVAGLISDAIDLMGSDRADAFVQRFAGAPAEQWNWHPWAPGFEWYLRRRSTDAAIPPYAAAIARDMLFLKAIPKVTTTAALRERTAQRIADEREGAIAEMRVAGGAVNLGIDAEWTAVTETDKADVLLREPEVEYQVKSRLPTVGDPLAPNRMTYIFEHLRKAAHQMAGNRPGVILMVIPGAGDWETWRASPDGQKFQHDLFDPHGLFDEPDFRAIPLLIIASGPHIRRDGAAVNVYQPAWAIPNPSATIALPPSTPIFTE